MRQQQHQQPALDPWTADVAGAIDSREARGRSLALIDEALRQFAHRPVVPATEIVDVLLDMRIAVVVDRAVTALFDDLEVH